MEVFISWSGSTSKKIAKLIKSYLPTFIQATQPYYTPNDVDKGTKWLNEILVHLNSSYVGIICITPDNTEKPWILFEAGALSNRHEQAIVCPLLFGIRKADIKGPLSIFQGTEFNKEDFYQLLQSINLKLGEKKLSEENLKVTFEMFFPKLEEEINKVLEEGISPEEAVSVERTEKDLLGEVLEIVRGLAQADAKKEREEVARQFAYKIGNNKATERFTTQLLHNRKYYRIVDEENPGEYINSTNDPDYAPEIADIATIVQNDKKDNEEPDN